MNNADGPAFLERELVGLGVDGYRQVRVCDRASGTVPIHTFREHLTCFPNVKSFTFFTLELVYQVLSQYYILSFVGCIHFPELWNFIVFSSL